MLLEAWKGFREGHLNVLILLMMWFIPKDKFWHLKFPALSKRETKYFISMKRYQKNRANHSNKRKKGSNHHPNNIGRFVEHKEWENHISQLGFWLFVKQCHPTGGPSKIELLQCYEVLWIHVIDAICNMRFSAILRYLLQVSTECGTFELFIFFFMKFV